MSRTMKAAVIHEAGGPEVLRLEEVPIPKPKPGQVLIRVKAFGLNRSELFTRQGHSPNVRFPRILGIEAVGLVEEAPGNEFQKGDIVATAMGDMGRQFDGGYAEYTCVPANQAQTMKTDLSWETLGALPEMLQTAWGSVFTALRLQKGDRLLVRGGTTSVGLAAAAIAKNHGAFVASTTRRPDRESLLRASGADQVFIDDGSISKQVNDVQADGFDKVLELVGMVGNKWSLDNFSPMGSIPTSVCLTTYAGDSSDFMATPYEELLQQVKAGTLKVHVGKVFTLDEIVEAHRCMEENKAGGKIVAPRETSQRSLPQAVAAGMLDPFEAHPPSSIPEVDALVHHYLATFIFRSFPFFARSPIVQLWWPYVRTDDVLFHVTLLLSSISLELLHHQQGGRYSNRLLGECISLLKDRVEDPVLGTSDHTIVAVANLANIGKPRSKLERANMRGVRMHLDGLTRMVNMRGGLSEVRKSNAMAGNVVFWLSLVAINEPELLPVYFGDVDERRRYFSHPLITSIGEGELDFRLYGVDEVTSIILLNIKCLSWRFMAHRNYDSPEEAVGSGYYPDPTMMSNVLVIRLESALTSMIMTTGSQNRLLLWLLTVGAISAAKMPERILYIGELVEVVTDFGIGSWDEMRESLREIAWQDNYCQVSSESVWEEVRLKKEALDLTSSTLHDSLG
ncbi:hypothetical protein B0A49_02985 [Cryomyces minteri]|uniref:Enoyl reductase (ER) domain-containing protein n=1 Tax=Cryomyces minteri TaxID=331657 RepID=A0A4U0XCP3_9PEZI|nr:hypothetical protein B0A49_02985 [Cryomyces minteri]